MIENAKILTGSPADVEKQLAEYLASHPSAAVLSSAVTASPKMTLLSALAEPIKPATAKGKAKAKAEAPPEEPTEPIADEATETREITVCIVVGIKL